MTIASAGAAGRISAWILAGFALFLAGCAECEMDLKVSRQGSAVLTVQAVAAAEDLEAIEPMIPALRAMGLDMSLTEALLASRNPSAPIPRAPFVNFARSFGPELKLDRVERTARGGKSGIRAVYRAADVSRLAWKAPAPAQDRVRMHFTPGRAALFRIVPDMAAGSRPTSGQDEGFSIQALDGLISAALKPLRARVTVSVEGRILQTSAARKAGDSSVVIADVDGRRLGVDALLRLGSTKGLSDAGALAAKPPAGVFLQDPTQPLVIRFEK